MARRKSNYRHFANFYIAGFTFYEGCMAIHRLRPGTKLTMERDADNRYDENAVAIYFDDFHLGYVPRSCNEQLAQLMDMGYGDIFELRVQRVAPEATPEHQVSAILYLKAREVEGDEDDIK